MNQICVLLWQSECSEKGITEQIKFQSSNETSEAQLRINQEISNNVLGWLVTVTLLFQRCNSCQIKYNFYKKILLHYSYKKHFFYLLIFLHLKKKRYVWEIIVLHRDPKSLWALFEALCAISYSRESRASTS